MEHNPVAVVAFGVVAAVAMMGMLLSVAGMKQQAPVGAYVWWDTYGQTGDTNQYAKQQPDMMDRYGNATERNAYLAYLKGLAENSKGAESTTQDQDSYISKEEYDAYLAKQKGN